MDETPIEVHKAKEGLHLLLVCRFWPFRNACDLDRVHFRLPFRDDEGEVFYPRLLKFAFAQAEVQLVLAEAFHDDARNAAVLLECVRVDKDVIQVHADDAFRYEVAEDVVHHRLERRGAVC